MYQILIVDDSILDIECITFLIRKFDLPLAYTTAVNGQKALEYLQDKSRHFDILFTDIKMPMMDGLALSRETRRLSPSTKIIIFSGFNDFEYAKTAITLGVQDYLMKPISPSDFEETVLRVIRSLEKEKEDARALQRQTHMAKNHILWRMIHTNDPFGQRPADISAQEGGVQNTEEALACPEYPQAYSALFLIEMEEDFFGTDGFHFQEELERLSSFSFDYLNLYPTRSILFIKEPVRECLLLSFAQSVCFLLQEDYKRKAYITFEPIDGNRSIHETYLRLEKKLETRFFFPERSILLPNDPGHNYSSAGHISMDILNDDLNLKDYASLSAHLEELFDSLRDDSTNSLIYVKYCFTELVKLLTRSISDPRWEPNILAEKIYGSSNINELIDMVRGIVSSLQLPPQSENDSLKSEKIKQYIYKNYASSLTLDEIADHFYISPNYLCSIFKKETGGNLIKFINDYRLKRAYELLTTTQMKVHSIAEAVGFRNTSYFCQLFRNSYGDTPENFRRRQRS